jgi:hypothetical protein
VAEWLAVLLPSEAVTPDVFFFVPRFIKALATKIIILKPTKRLFLYGLDHGLIVSTIVHSCSGLFEKTQIKKSIFSGFFKTQCNGWEVILKGSDQ